MTAFSFKETDSQIMNLMKAKCVCVCVCDQRVADKKKKDLFQSFLHTFGYLTPLYLREHPHMNPRHKRVDNPLSMLDEK